MMIPMFLMITLIDQKSLVVKAKLNKLQFKDDWIMEIGLDYRIIIGLGKKALPN